MTLYLLSFYLALLTTQKTCLADFASCCQDYRRPCKTIYQSLRENFEPISLLTKVVLTMHAPLLGHPIPFGVPLWGYWPFSSWFSSFHHRKCHSRGGDNEGNFALAWCFIITSLWIVFRTSLYYLLIWLFSPELWLFFLSKNGSKIHSWRPNTIKETLHWPRILWKPSYKKFSWQV